MKPTEPPGREHITASDSRLHLKDGLAQVWEEADFLKWCVLYFCFTSVDYNKQRKQKQVHKKVTRAALHWTG